MKRLVCLNFVGLIKSRQFAQLRIEMPIPVQLDTVLNLGDN